jgi:hypothetical protein
MKYIKYASKMAKTFGASRRGRGGGGCPTGAERRRRHRGEVAEGEEGMQHPIYF